MPYVQRTDGIVSGCFSNPQTGYAEEWLDDDHADVVAYLEGLNTPPAAGQASPVLCCLANLYVDGGDVTGIETATGLMMAFMADVDKIWVFFTDPMQDTSYGWNVSTTSGSVRVTDRQLEYIEITIQEFTEPFWLSISIMKVV